MKKVAGYHYRNDLPFSNFSNIRICFQVSLWFHSNKSVSYFYHQRVYAQNAHGVIPKELLDLPFLTFLKIDANFLTGQLPAFIGNMSRLRFLSIANNDFQRNLEILRSLICLLALVDETLSINCGGPQRTFNGNEFEDDSETLGAATIYVANTQKWAVRNVGLFADRSDQQYVQNALGQVTNSNTWALYQTSRLSPGSLRYYGLGLQNGPYNGTRQVRDFVISKEAGGVEIPITKNFTANVTENHLEIHMFWAGKGTCCIPEQGSYGPSISAVSVVPNFGPPSGKEKNQTILVVSITVSVAIVGVVVLILIFSIIYVKRRKDEDDDDHHEKGEGGFGAVYKGTLSDGRVVAVKQLSVASHHGKNQFIAEVATISAVQHRNLVKLYGCCIEGNRHLLVYEYLENKSLDQALFGQSDLHLDWPTRFNICLATARGLAYLHEDSHPRIVHRDIKASNILLDAELCPKISDFGLAKLYDDKNTHISTRVAGTFLTPWFCKPSKKLDIGILWIHIHHQVVLSCTGYLASEYAMRGHLTEKVDVFGFGIVVLEIVSGRSNSDNSLEEDKIYLLEWAIDPSLVEFDENEALRVVRVALMCTQGSPIMRPPMSRVVAMLAGDIQVSGAIIRPSYLTDWHFKDLTVTL
ncbi:hypothetical protein DITRI_Ditri19aG0075000 [Diplodiscus trichospermus]